LRIHLHDQSPDHKTTPGRKTTPAGKTSPGDKTGPGSTTLPSGVLGPGSGSSGSGTLPPGYNLLLAVNGLSGRDGPDGLTLGAALAVFLLVLTTPAVILGRRRRGREHAMATDEARK
jgi:hypothetical protein